MRILKRCKEGRIDKFVIDYVISRIVPVIIEKGIEFRVKRRNTCLECGSLVPPRRGGLGKYCSTRCSDRVYKRRHDRFNRKRDPIEHARKIRKTRKEKNLCVRCGKEKAEGITTATCLDCLDEVY